MTRTQIDRSGGALQTQRLTYKHILTFITCALAITGPAAITYSCAGMNYQGVANYLEVPVSSVAFYMSLVFLSIAIFAAPLIFCRTHSGLNIPKYVFYAFYPAHLLLVALLRFAAGA